MIGKGYSIGSPFLARENITAEDAAIPAKGSGVDLKNFQFAVAFVKIVGGGCNLTPFYYRDALGAYIPGDAEVLTGSKAVLIDADGIKDLWLHLDSFTGTPTIDIEILPMNRT